jgi:ribosomal protein S18 acetylase RimI-like enzyme
MSDIRIIEANLSDPVHQAAVLELTRDYARDPMGNGADLAADTRARLVDGLRQHPTTLVFLALRGERPVAIATCFIGFSTFAARPLINVHDLHVGKAVRRRGVGRALLEAIESKARALGCCKITLEVQEQNHPARHLYQAQGFTAGEYEPGAGGVLFRQKAL